MVDRVQLTKYETSALGGDDADTLPYPAPIDAQEDAVEVAGVYLQDASNRDETVLIDRNGDDMRFTDPNNSGGLTLSQLVRNVSKVGTPADNQLAVWTGDGTIEGTAAWTYNGSVLSGNKLALTGPIRMTEAASPDGDTAGTGQIWVKDNTPNDLYFRDDTGVDHLVSLAESEYAKLSGRAGGQILRGGTEASQDLTLVSTASATRGHVYFGAAQTSGFDEVNGWLGIGTAAPETPLHVLTGDAGIAPGFGAMLTLEAADSWVTLQLLTSNTGVGAIYFGDEDSASGARLQYEHTSDLYRLYLGNQQKLSVTSTYAWFDVPLYFGASSHVIAKSGDDLTFKDTNNSTPVTLSTLVAGVSASGTPVNDQLAVWTNSSTIEGSSALTYASYDLSLLTPNTATAGLLFGDPEDSDAGHIRYDHTTNTLSLGQGGFPRLYIYNSSVGINEPAPLGKLHIKSADVGEITPSTLGLQLVLENSGDAGLTIYSGATSTGSVIFADVNDDYVSSLDYDHNSGEMGFYVNNAYRAYMTSTYYRLNVPLQFDGTATVIDRDGGGNMTFTDAVAGTKSLSQLAAGSGDVSVSGTPVNNQLAIWTDSSTIEGSAALTYDNLYTFKFTAAYPRLQVLTNIAGSASINVNSAGVDLICGLMTTSSKYTPAIKFMSTDANFTTENPKLLAYIAGVAIESYTGDTDAGMDLQFWASPINGGAENTPNLAMAVKATAVELDVPLWFEDAGVYLDRDVDDLKFYSIDAGTKNLADLVSKTGSPNTGYLTYWSGTGTITSASSLVYSGTYLETGVPVYFGNSSTTIANVSDDLTFKDLNAGTRTLSSLLGTTGTPADDQIAVFTSATAVESSANLTFGSGVLAVYNSAATEILLESTSTSANESINFRTNSTGFRSWWETGAYGSSHASYPGAYYVMHVENAASTTLNHHVYMINDSQDHIIGGTSPLDSATKLTIRDGSTRVGIINDSTAYQSYGELYFCNYDSVAKGAWRMGSRAVNAGIYQNQGGFYLNHDKDNSGSAGTGVVLEISDAGNVLIGASTSSGEADRTLHLNRATDSGIRIQSLAASTPYCDIYTDANGSLWLAADVGDAVASSAVMFKCDGSTVGTWTETELQVNGWAGGDVLKVWSSADTGIRIADGDAVARIGTDENSRLLLESDPDGTTAGSEIQFHIDGSFTGIKIDTAGRMLLGGSYTGLYPFEIRNSADYIYTARFWNDTNSASYYGIGILAGLDTPTANSHCRWIDLADGNGTVWSYIGYATSSPYAAFYAASDERLKKNIAPTQVDGLAVINGIALKRFDWHDEKRPHQDIGYVAQQVRDVYPAMVAEDEDGMLSVSDSCLVPVLVKAVQELQARIEQLEARLN